MKYDLHSNESEVLPNLLKLTDPKAIGEAEFEGFLTCQLALAENLTKTTIFNTTYIKQIHYLALSHLYEFAGKFRNVNLSKGGFAFPAARFLDASMATFDQDVLTKMPHKYVSSESLIKDVAIVHAELLFIHPFREGNGRTARILANLMVRKQGCNPIDFKDVDFDLYVKAVQMAAGKKYKLMEDLIKPICFC
ncbi:MAG TPA: Fic family protein [Puia sp.]|nr:Fic family protein [Puia sp.]